MTKDIRSEVERTEALAQHLRASGRPNTSNDEAQALAHLLIELEEISQAILTRIAAVADASDSHEIEAHLHAIGEELRHLLILIPTTRTYSHLLPEES